MVLLGPTIGGLRKLLAICEDYANKHGLKYNSNKSELLVFKGRNKPPNSVPPVYLNGSPLKRVTQFRYLGHIVNEDLKDDCDIERERRALSVRGNMLARRFAGCTLNVKVTLFKAFCQIFYTSSLWTSYSQKSYSALRILYNNLFRMMVGLPRHCSASGMFADAHTDDFFALMRKKVASLIRRVRGSSNSLLQVVEGRLDGAVLGRFNELHATRAPR
ncbi:uncharacterized protein LOC113240326 [Hyposmocoma kahamanoa]|uniref:uncharacterized protein LOC113240326 n=1 Tax=Hyposmocoma kahamanoa TaxID=1477025 RepID=UPI000E6D7397|nr:uncharacterized protein LOC113240326 [Hyposmocoma kahamanoa]